MRNSLTVLASSGEADERMLAVVAQDPKRKGKQDRLAMDKDVPIFKKAKKHLSEKREHLRVAWRIDSVPNEPTPKVKGPETERGFAIRNYNLNNVIVEIR